MRSPCSCKEPDRRLWRVTQFRSNRSAFSGGRETSSAYSQLRCLQCGHYWRTKAKYVEEIAQAEKDEGYRLTPRSTNPETGEPGQESRPWTRAQQLAAEAETRQAETLELAECAFLPVRIATIILRKNATLGLFTSLKLAMPADEASRLGLTEGDCVVALYRDGYTNGSNLAKVILRKGQCGIVMRDGTEDRLDTSQLEPVTGDPVIVAQEQKL